MSEDSEYREYVSEAHAPNRQTRMVKFRLPIPEGVAKADYTPTISIDWAPNGSPVVSTNGTPRPEIKVTIMTWGPS